MSSPDDHVDRRFADFCRTGDPDALGEVFDATAGRLLRIALWLCGNRADAEDALQRTFLEAIAARERFARGRPALPWLVGLLGHQAQKVRRERARRAPPAPPAAAGDPVVAAATAELEAAIETVRAQLGEPYREVLRLHLETGLAAREIAARLRRPAGTVRTQLVRALQALRERLPSGFLAGMAPAWLGDAAAPRLGALRDVVLTEARTQAQAALRGTGRTAAATRHLRWSAMAGTCAALLATAVWSWSQFAAALTTPPAYLVLAANAAPDEAPFVATNRSGEPDAGRREPAAVAARSGRVEVLLRWAHDGSPAAGQAASCAAGAHPLREQRAVSDADGRCVFERVEPGIVNVRADAGAFEHFSFGAGEQRVVELRCARGIEVVGAVVDAGQRAAGNAAIVASRLGMSRPPVVVAHTDDAGRFRVHVPCGTDLHAFAAGHGPSVAWPIEGQPGEMQERTLRLRGPGGALAGTVRDQDGRAMPFARLVAGALSPAPSRDPEYAAYKVQEPPGCPVSADAEGRFRIDGLPVGAQRVQAWAIGCAPWCGEAAIRASTTTERDVVLLPGAAVAGTVREANGDAVAGAGVDLGSDAERLGGVYLWTDAAGRFAADSLPAGDLAAKAGKFPHGSAHAELDLAAGQVATWDPILDAGRCVRGHVLDEVGRPMARATVGWQRRGRDREAFRQTDARGQFVLTNVPDEPVDVILYGAHWQALATERGVRAPRDGVVLAVDAAHAPNASLRGRIVDEHGVPLRARIWGVPLRAGIGYYDWRAPNAADGTFLVDALCPGHHTLVVEVDGKGRLPWRSVELTANACFDAGDFVLRPPCTLTVRATDADGAVARGVVFTTVDGLPGPHAEIRSGLARVEGLQPRRYELRCTGNRAEGVAVVDVVAGAANEVTVRLHAVVLCKVRCSAPHAMPDGTTAEVVVAAGNGEPRRCRAPVTDDDHAGENLYLPPGRHVLRATCGDALTGTIEVEVEEPFFGEKVLRVHVPLRAAGGR